MSDFEQIHRVLHYPTSVERYVSPTVLVGDRLVSDEGDGQSDASIEAMVRTATAELPGRELYVRLNEVVVLDGFDPFYEPKNEIRLVGFVVDSNAAEPIQFATPFTFPNVKAGTKLPIGSPGLAMYYTNTSKLPSFFTMHLLVVEDDSGIRDLGKAISDIRASKEYGIIKEAAVALATASNPAYGTMIKIGDALMGLIARNMEQNKDDIISYFAATYTLTFDKLGVGRHTFYQRGRSSVGYEILLH